MKPYRIRSREPQFPACLREIPDPPREIYVLGDLESVMKMPRLSMVGTRKVSPYGRYVTTMFAGQCASRGLAIISGLALGVDALAHKAALEASGATLAVLACGLDQITPATNFQLGKHILQKGGAIISEYPPGSPPKPHNFIARNRLVSGISDGVLITEAAAKSGTMHTANFALEQGRPVLAVPGPINNPLSEGTNNLIKTGAIPITTTADIMLALGLDQQSNEQPEIFGASPEELSILTMIQQGITDSSALLNQSKLSASDFSQTLTMLEITGRIRPMGSGHWALNH